MNIPFKMKVVETEAAACCLDYDKDDGILVVGCMDGTIIKIDEQGQVVSKIKVFKKSVRNVKCLSAHQVLCSSSDGFLALTTLKEIIFRVKIASHPISAIENLPDVNLIAVGTDNGDLYAVDFEDPKQIKFMIEAHDDSINSIVYSGPKKTLITCASDGSIAVLDVKREKKIAKSECLEDELLSMLLMSNGTKICCGSALGVVNIFKWGLFGIPSQRIKDFKSEINSMCSVDSRRFVVGSSTGIIQLIDETKKAASMTMDHSVESMACHDGRVAHIDQDGVVRLWNLCDLTGQSSATSKEDIDRATFLDGFK